MSCTSCGLPIASDARFCSHCGASQAAGGEERRVVTVLFADLVGFTSLAEHRDPEEVKHLVDRAFERLARDITTFGGVVDKVLGDCIVALFGAPIAHEDDSERAVRAGLRMQQTMQGLAGRSDPKLELRIGVNTGEVLVGTTMAGGDYTAMGDVMNSAARLQELADPGETLVGVATRLATGDAITYREAGSLPARGRDEPIEAWVALAAVRPPGIQRQRRGAVFVGRHHELALLAAQARLAIDGNRAQLSYIVGEAGMGKTRLISEVSAAMVAQFGTTVLEGRCLPYGEANVWWPVADLVRHLFGLSFELPVADARARLRQALAEHLPDTGSPDIERFTVALLHALGYQTPLRGGDRNRNRSEVMLAFTTLLDEELRRRPVVIILSEMHWAAEAVWLLAEHVLTELARRPLVMLMTARLSEDDRLPRGRHGLSVIQLGPLDDNASAELLAQLGLELPERTVVELVERSGGNPFFLEELAGLVVKQGVVTSQAGLDYEVDHLDDLPATLRGLIAARLDALDAGERALLEDASVLGRTGSIDGLVILAAKSREAENVTATLASLIDKDLIELNGARFRFRSDLVRDVAYGRLTKTVRAQRHHGIAQYLEGMQGPTVRNSVVVAIAEHYRATAQLVGEVSDVPGVDPAEVVGRALYWLEQAGERALDVGAPAQAIRWYDSAVELATDDEVLAQYLYGRAKARSEVHDIGGARADLDRLDGVANRDPVMMAKALLVRGEVDRKAGDLDQAAARLREAADRLAALDVPDQQVLALRLLGMTEMFRSDDQLARQALECSRSVAMEAGDRRGEAWALQSLAWRAFRLGRVIEARTLVDEAVAIFTELDDRGGLVWTQGVEAWVAFHTGDWASARRLVDAVLPETRRRGDPWAEAIMLNLDASLELWSGQAQRAVDIAQHARAVAERVDDATLGVEARAIEGRALVSLGRIDEGTDMLESSYALAEQADDRESRRVAVITNCASAARLGEPERAIRWAARYEGMHDDPAVVGEADLMVSLALAMLQRGAVDEAASQLSWVEDAGSEHVEHFADAVGAMLAAAMGATERCEQLTAKTLAGRSTYLDRVFALLARAAARTQTNDLDGCDEALAAARAELEPTDDQPARRLVELVAAVCGRSSLADAEDRMRSSGLDPSGWERAWALAVRPTAEPAPD